MGAIGVGEARDEQIGRDRRAIRAQIALLKPERRGAVLQHRKHIDAALQIARVGNVAKRGADDIALPALEQIKKGLVGLKDDPVQ